MARSRTTPNAYELRNSGQGVAADLQIPQALRNEIEDWIDQFKTHFRHLGDRPVDQPVWTNGFDEPHWIPRRVLLNQAA